MGSSKSLNGNGDTTESEGIWFQLGGFFTADLLLEIVELENFITAKNLAIIGSPFTLQINANTVKGPGFYFYCRV